MLMYWRMLLGVAVTAGLGLPAGASGADQKKPAAQQGPSAEPGSIHKRLASLAGRYTTVSKFWMKPGDKPMVSKGRAKFTAILGGRFVQEEDSGKMLGKPYKSLKLWGYNADAQRYESTWVYTGSTAQMMLTGASKDDDKTITWTATVGGKDGAKMTLHVVTQQPDEDHFVVELSMKSPDGTKGPTFETRYTRKK
jgi:hypothetical protein